VPPIDSLLTTLIKRLISPLAGGPSDDGRGRRFVAIIDCMLNQNARDLGAARFPAMNFELLRICHEHQVGVLQMRCPEIAALGLKRTRQPRQSIRDVLDTDAGRRCCAGLACDVADRVEAYLAEGYVLLAVLGGNPRSPGCAVHEGADGLRDDSGVFMKQLEAEFRRRNLHARFKGIRDHDAELLAQDHRWFRDLVLADKAQARRMA
jgi:predicted secreted protein